MPIDAKNIREKLAAIAAKDVDKIMAQNVDIPVLGENYTKDALVAWLKRLSDYLNKMLLMEGKEIEVTQEKDALYTELSLSEKVAADKILTDVEPSDAFTTIEAWDKLTELRFLYSFGIGAKAVAAEEI